MIGINGYIGSGKDEVGKIIQYLTSDYYPHKTYKRFLEKTDSEWGPPYSEWQIKKFAGKLKQVASLLTGISVEKFEDQEFKKEILGEEWAIYKKSYKLRFGSVREFEIDKNEYLELLSDTNWRVSRQAMTVREFLQKLGTDAVRFGLHPNTWVNALFSDYKEDTLTDKPNKLSDHPKLVSLGIKQFVPVYPKWIITDTRFPNEAKAIKDRGGIVIRVVRDINITGSYGIGKNGFKCISVSGHASETSLDDWDFDHIIRNEGSIEELIIQVQIFLNNFNLNN